MSNEGMFVKVKNRIQLKYIKKIYIKISPFIDSCSCCIPSNSSLTLAAFLILFVWVVIGLSFL